MGIADKFANAKNVVEIGYKTDEIANIFNNAMMSVESNNFVTGANPDVKLITNCIKDAEEIRDYSDNSEKIVEIIQELDVKVLNNKNDVINRPFYISFTGDKKSDRGCLCDLVVNGAIVRQNDIIYKELLAWTGLKKIIDDKISLYEFYCRGHKIINVFVYHSGLAIQINTLDITRYALKIIRSRLTKEQYIYLFGKDELVCGDDNITYDVCEKYLFYRLLSNQFSRSAGKKSEYKLQMDDENKSWGSYKDDKWKQKNKFKGYR